MKAVLRIEYIGAATWDRLRQFERFEEIVIGGKKTPSDDDYMSQPGPRVLEYRLEDGAWIVSRVHGRRDYSRANSRGTRGVMVNHIIESGALYRVKEPVSWRSMAHYFVSVTADGGLLRMTKEEALEWASAHLV